MSWFNSLSIRQKIFTGCYLIAALFSLGIILLMFFGGVNIVLGILTIAVFAAITYPVARTIEGALTESIDEMTHVAFRIAKGDFSQRVDASASVGELGHSFNSMIDKLKEILNDTSN